MFFLIYSMFINVESNSNEKYSIIKFGLLNLWKTYYIILRNIKNWVQAYFPYDFWSATSKQI